MYQRIRHSIAQPVASTLVGLSLVTSGVHSLAACTPATSPPDSTPCVTAHAMIDESANGKHVWISHGQTLRIALPDNSGSTGYVWTIGPHDTTILKEQGKPQHTPPANSLPGAPGTVTFCFTAAGTGQTPVTLNLGRPWEPGAAAKTYQVLVTVH